jgi:hypothetical protein
MVATTTCSVAGHLLVQLLVLVLLVQLLVLVLLVQLHWWWVVGHTQPEVAQKGRRVVGRRHHQLLVHTSVFPSGTLVTGLPSSVTLGRWLLHFSSRQNLVWSRCQVGSSGSCEVVRCTASIQHVLCWFRSPWVFCCVVC